MSKDIRVKVQRAGSNTVVYPDIAIQLDTMSQVEAAYYGGAAPYFRFYGYILGNYTILYQDLLTNITTNQHYRVVNNPNDDNFPDLHAELVLDRVQGT